MKRFLTPLVCTAGLLLVVGTTRFVFPDGAPNGILLEGVVSGCRNALLAAGLILVYRSARIINFAQAVLGAVGASVVFQLGGVGIEGIGRVPFVVSFFVGLLVALLLGLLIELIFVRRFFNSPRLVLTVVTVVAAPTFAQFPAMITGLPIWQRPEDIVQIQAQGEYPPIFPSWGFEVYPLRFGFAEVLTVVVTVVALGLLAVFFRFSRLGAAVRGTSENADRALLLGINVKLLSTLVWAMAAVLSGLALILFGLDHSFTSGGTLEPTYLLPALAAVVLARLRSLPVTVVVAIGLGMLEQAISWSYPGGVAYEVIVLATVLGGLFLQRSAYSRVEGGMTSSWKATEEIRPTPKELLVVPGIRRMRRILMGVVVVSILVFPQAYSTSQANLAALIAIYAIVALSLVVLTGWGGQVSLGQFALVAVGALVSSKLTGDIGISFWFALPIAAVATAAVAAVVGMPALRIRGPFLAVTTLAFAEAVRRVAFESSAFGWLRADTIERPSLLFVSLTSERNYYYLCVAFAVVAAIVVRRLRAGRPGRVLIAIREDEYGVQPFGISAARSRLAVFALAGGLAGVAGTLFVHHQRSIEVESFGADASVDLFIMAMIGGITSVSGALLGATYIGLTRFLIADEQIRQLSNGLGLLYLLIMAPGGLASLAYGVRDAILRLVALRRRIAVPSLFQDYDPEAVARQKVVLGSTIDGRGLEALPAGQRYAVPSDLYQSSVRTGPPAHVAAVAVLEEPA